MKFLISLSFALILSSVASSQTIVLKGKITDEQNKPVPFASIYIKNTSNGTSANDAGEFQLKLVPGSYEVIFKSIGYATQTQNITVDKNQTLNIILKAEAFQLKDVVIRSGGEDHSYSIIRKAIRERKSYQKQVKPYSAEVYIKGLQRILKAPKKFFGTDMDKVGKEIGLDSNRRGIVYLSESESKLSFMPPDTFKEEMISSKVSGSNKSFSFNRASEMNVDFYNNYQNWQGLSNRPIISPIADNALSYYSYKFLGTTIENGIEVNKIRVTPKRKGDPVFHGDIYIVEDTWRIYSADLYLTKSAGINFVDTLRIKQNFVPITQKDWKPSSTRFDFIAGFMGFELAGYYIAVYSNYNLDQAFDKKEFKEVMRVTKEVNKKDSTYWMHARPIPLTDEERDDYTKKQILATKRESKTHLDSLDKAQNKFKPGRFLLLGYTYRNRYRKESFHFNSLLTSTYYNTVEGWGLDYGVSYTRNIDTATNRYLRLAVNARYAFSSKLFNPSITGNLPLKHANIGFKLGSDMLDMNAQNPTPELANSYNSLVHERNLLKIYQKKFAEISLSKRISGGLYGYMSAEVSERKWLPNTSNYSWRDVDDRSFTSNNPFTSDTETPLFPKHQAFIFNFNLSYNFSNKYVTYPSGKYFIPSKYPTVNLTYRTSVKDVLGSDTRFSQLSASVNKSDISLGLYGKSSFWFGTGKFFDVTNIYYTDYKHFAGNQSLSYESRLNRFLFLDLYTFSTNQSYIEGHIQHNFSGLLMSKLPLIRKLKLQEIIGFNYLNTDILKNHMEIFAGLQFKNMVFQYGYAYNNGKQIQSGFRLAFKLQP